MNADPEKGQPTTVPETTASEQNPPEATESEVAEPEGTEPEPEAASETPELEAAAPEIAAPEADEPEAAAPEIAAPEAAEPEPAEPEAAAPEIAEPEAAEPEAAAPEPEAPEPRLPPRAASTSLVAGRYRLVSEIGGGAMGVVWRARDEVLGRDVAVKELRPDHGMSGAQVRTSHQRARREGRIAARLQHPNAVVIYDVAEHEGRPYLIMEYVPSQSLGDILATGTVLTPTEVTSIGAQLASALTAAHERGIVHRDIKPGNVLMTADGTVKLTDFGISRAAGDATVTATGEILGTPAYTAPEVAQGHPVAFPADVFSLGATLYAAVEGTPPFGDDQNAMATLLRVVRNEIRLPKRSGPLTDTIMRMLSPEPGDRPTMKQVWQGLDAQSAKPLPVADIRLSVPVTKAFEAPSPTLVVTDPLSAKRMAAEPEAPSKPMSAAAAASTPVPPVLEPLPAPTPTPSSISARVTAPTPTPLPAPTPAQDPEPTSVPMAPIPATPSTTSSSAVHGATPTSAMSPAPSPTRDTALSRSTTTSATAKSVAKTPPPTSDDPAASPAPPPPPERRSRSRMPLAITVCVVGTGVLVAAILIAMNSGGSSGNQPVAHGATTPTHSSAAKPTTASSQSAAAPTGTPSAPSTPSTSASTSPSKPTSSSPSSSPSTTPSSPADVAAQMSAFITNYYGLLPGNLTAAWPQMTPAYQTIVARGFANYQSFWNGYQQVTVSDVVATPPSTVVATIHYVSKDGTRNDERTSFGLVKDGNSWKIDTSHVLG